MRIEGLERDQFNCILMALHKDLGRIYGLRDEYGNSEVLMLDEKKTKELIELIKKQEFLDANN